MSDQYEIDTWDPDLQRWTPQIGLPPNPMDEDTYQQALKLLTDMGYGINPLDSPSVFIHKNGEAIY